MNFLFDENFPKSAERILVDLGHYVIDIRGSDLQGADDFQLFDVAQQNEAILLTTDRDFYHTVPLEYETHFGVVVIALKQPNRNAILARLRWLLAQGLLDAAKNKVIMLRDNTYRIR